MALRFVDYINLLGEPPTPAELIKAQALAVRIRKLFKDRPVDIRFGKVVRPTVTTVMVEGK